MNEYISPMAKVSPTNLHAIYTNSLPLRPCRVQVASTKFPAILNRVFHGGGSIKQALIRVVGRALGLFQNSRESHKGASG